LLENTVEKNNITNNNIYNAGMSGLTVVQKMPNLLAKRRKQQVGSIKIKKKVILLTPYIL